MIDNKKNSAADLIEEIVHIRGVMDWDDLTKTEMENLLDRADQDGLLGVEYSCSDLLFDVDYREKLIDKLNVMIIDNHTEQYPTSNEEWYGDSVSSDRRDFAAEYNMGGFHEPW